MTAKQTKIVAFGSVVAVALVALAWFIGVSPQLSKANESKAAQAQAITATDSLRVNLASLQQKETELGEASREYEDLARQFPDSFQPSEWVTMVMSAASQSGVKLTTIAPSVPQLGAVAGTAPAAGAVPAAPVPPVDPAATESTAGGDTLATSSVSLTAEGSPAALRDFLRRIGEMARPILIENASITATEGTGSTLSLTGRTFLMRALDDPSAAVTDATTTPSSAPPVDQSSTTLPETTETTETP